ncbi:MAG: hypothetical protein ABF946_09115 [Acetobacter papayae]
MFPEYDPEKPVQSVAAMSALAQIAITAILTKASPDVFSEFEKAMKDGAKAAAAQNPSFAKGCMDWLEHVEKKRQKSD